MAFDFPSSPLPNDVFTDTATGTSYTFSGVAWKRTGQTSATENYVEEAPNTGNPYSRQSAGWVPRRSAPAPLPPGPSHPVTGARWSRRRL